MKEKILWIIAASIFCLAYTLLTIFPPSGYQANKLMYLLKNTGIMLIFTGAIIFPLTLLIALVLPKKRIYKQRFNKLLPFFVIFSGLTLIFATLANAW